MSGSIPEEPHPFIPSPHAGRGHKAQLYGGGVEKLGETPKPLPFIPSSHAGRGHKAQLYGGGVEKLGKVGVIIRNCQGEGV